MKFYFVCKRADANYKNIDLVKGMIFESMLPNAATTSANFDLGQSASATYLGSTVKGCLGSSLWIMASRTSFLMTHRQSSDDVSNYLSLALTEDEVQMLK